MELTRSLPLPLADVAGERPRVRHFSFLAAEDESTLFHEPPQPFGRCSPKAELAHALGATLYTPSIHPRLASKLAKAVHDGVMSTVVDLEDSIADDQVAAAEANLLEQFGRLAEEPSPALPLVFLRPRDPDHLKGLGARLNGALHLVAGFVLPKFCAANADRWIGAFHQVTTGSPVPMYAMPVLEGPELLYRESRLAELLALADVFGEHRSSVLAVRVGATDLCGLLGLRRSVDETIYDLAPLRDCIADVVNVLGRPSTGLVVTGPVWEYFDRQERIWKPQLRESLFERHSATGRALRARLINRHLDGLIAEVMADRANGLVGKTVIHPSHVRAVNALSVVTLEEYQDALSILHQAGTGACASSFGNKMNEPKPHRAWGDRILARARAFGVYAEGISFVELLDV